jgi:hypothetical protein
MERLESETIPASGEKYKRDLFEIENARNMTVSQLTSTFYPTKSFWRLLSAKNHIVLGARGSGKTALTRMLWHDHLAACNDNKAKEAIRSRAFIGIYTTTRVDWVGGLKNCPLADEGERERLFCWRLNLACCSSFLVTASSCIRTYELDAVLQAKMEMSLARALGESWLGCSDIRSLKQLQIALEDAEDRRYALLAQFRVTGNPNLLKDPTGAYFENELFTPLRRGIQLLSRHLDIGASTSWLLCLDEAEYLEPVHQRLINTHMRGATGNLFFKLTTLPYLHHTLETNLRVPLNIGDDFEYVYIDQDPVILAGTDGREGVPFAENLFYRRAIQSGGKYKSVTLRTLLGQSPLLECKENAWSKGSQAWGLLTKYASDSTRSRAHRLADKPPKFGNEIGRKILPALLLRAAVDETTGRGEIDVYRGEAFAVRCGDANPRRLIRLFNSLMVEKAPKRNSELRVEEMSGREQTRIFKKFAASLLSGSQTEKLLGSRLHGLLNTAGNEMARRFYSEPVGTDQYYSVEVSEDVSDADWDIIKYGVAYGYLYPNINANNPDVMPWKKGVFRLAYCLAPAFNLLPRRGKAINLRQLMQQKDSYRSKNTTIGAQRELPLLPAE